MLTPSAVTTSPVDPGGSNTSRARRAGRRCAHLVPIAREGAGPYGIDRTGETAEGDLRAAVRTAAAALREVRWLALKTGASRGELGALIELLPALDAGHAAAVGLADRVEAQDLAPQRPRSGLPVPRLHPARRVDRSPPRAVTHR
ncbi:MAG: hypothetical protein R6V28_01270 [Nitriliruptoraceae bacterium]